MKQIPELIDRALEKTGTVSALGKALGIPPAMVSMWKNGTKPCPPEDQARIAAIAGIDPIQTLVRAHIEKHEGTEKGDQLARVLGTFFGSDWRGSRYKWSKRSGDLFTGI